MTRPSPPGFEPAGLEPARKTCAFVVYGSVDQISGGYLYDRRVISALRARGWSVQVVGLKSLPYLLAPLQGLGRNVRGLFRTGRRNLLAAGDVPKTLTGFSFDCVVVDELVHPSVWPALLGKRVRTGGIVVLVHHLRSQERRAAPGRLFVLRFERTLLRRADLVVTTGPTTARLLFPLLAPGTPVVTCMPGTDALRGAGFDAARRDLEFRDAASPNDGGKEAALAPKSGPGAGASPNNAPVRILAVGILIPRKGFHRLVQALASMRDLRWECTIAGDDGRDPRYAARLRGAVERAGLSERVRIPGRVRGEELEALYRGAHVFAFPSELEGFGIALAEALWFGVPYVAARGGALPELTGREELFHAAPEGNVYKTEGGLVGEGPAAFSRALESLLTDGPLRGNLAREARARALSLPTWEETGRCFADALDAVTSGSGGCTR